MAGKGLESLRRWKKCQRRVANAVERAAARSGVAKSVNRIGELRAAANRIGAIVCSKGTKGKKGKGKRSSKRRSGVVTRAERNRYLRFNPPDFSRNLLTHTPEYEAPFNPEVF